VFDIRKAVLKSDSHDDVCHPSAHQIVEHPGVPRRVCGQLPQGHESAKEWAPFEAPMSRRSSLQSISTVDLDISRSVFQVHSVDAACQWSVPTVAARHTTFSRDRSSASGRGTRRELARPEHSR
jgi:hypothetical protein